MQVRQELREYLRKNHLFTADTAGLRDDLSLITGGVIDSIGILEMIAFLESRFGIVVDEEDMVPDNLDSIVSIEAFIGRKRSQVQV